MKIKIQNGPEFDARDGENLLSALGHAGVPVSAPCGGKHRCGKCQVRIIAGTVKSIQEKPEPGSIPSETLKNGIVLACMTIPESDLTIELISENTYEGGAYQKISSGNQKPASRTGVALDIGTTTVSARLVDLDTGNELDTYSALNKQRVFGADVMSRIGAARNGKTSELHKIINNQTNEILTGFKSKFGLSKIETLAVAANTTMLHLFVNENPAMMGEIPFTPVFIEEREYKGSDFNLPVDKILLFPSISAFIGADVVSGLAVINVLDLKETIFFIDIGTNGEMALFHNGKLFCTSAAAGPALEGAEISCGVGSIRGAINKVEWVDGKLSWDTIGGDAPAGICGCGLIDAMSIMLEKEIIDDTGAFNDDDREDFKITEGVSLTNRDVRQYQLAKSAILSAIRIVCKNAGIDLNMIKKVFVAGGLGFYINQNSAVRTGLLPEEFLNRVEICGNTSLKGAVKALLDPGFFEYCKKIKGVSEIMELASDPVFMDAFAENMIFPS